MSTGVLFTDAPRLDSEVPDALPPDEILEAAVVAVWRDPDNKWLLSDLAALLMPIAKKQAWRCSLCQEDRMEATSQILAHLLEGARPPSHRRLRSRTRQAVSGYTPGGKPAEFFPVLPKISAWIL